MIVRDKDAPFMVPRRVIENKLSLEAVGVYAFVASREETTREEICAHFQIPRHHVEYALSELHQHGLVTDTKPPTPIEQTNDSPESSCEPGYVYVIKAGPYYKIGRTKKLNQRMTQLSIQLPFPVEIVTSAYVKNMVGVERRLHLTFTEKRRNGEWFQLSPDDLELLYELL